MVHLYDWSAEDWAGDIDEARRRQEDNEKALRLSIAVDVALAPSPEITEAFGDPYAEVAVMLGLEIVGEGLVEVSIPKSPVTAALTGTTAAMQFADRALAAAFCEAVLAQVHEAIDHPLQLDYETSNVKRLLKQIPLGEADQ